MFESIIGSTTADGVVYVKASLICVVAALLMGISLVPVQFPSVLTNEKLFPSTNASISVNVS